MATICYCSSILMKFWCSKLSLNILINNTNRPILYMTTSRYIGPMRPILTYLQQSRDWLLMEAQKDKPSSTLLIMLTQNIFNKYFIDWQMSPKLYCKLLIKMNIPSARIYKKQILFHGIHLKSNSKFLSHVYFLKNTLPSEL